MPQLFSFWNTRHWYLKFSPAATCEVYTNASRDNSRSFGEVGGSQLTRRNILITAFLSWGFFLAMKCYTGRVETLLRNKPCILERLSVWKCINSDQLLLVLNPEEPES